jgi:hypothetical protein
MARPEFDIVTREKPSRVTRGELNGILRGKRFSIAKAEPDIVEGEDSIGGMVWEFEGLSSRLTFENDRW